MKDNSTAVPKKKKRIGKILLIILCVILALAVIGTVINSMIAKNKMAEYANAYGEFADTPAGRINYTVSGEGDRTIVILPGLGSASPHFEFTELAGLLSAENKVIIIEPLGYGLSDDTDTERTSENICDEIHTVLQSLGEEKYFIMGHSISGVYALEYANRYTDEMLGFIGIDASLPEQINDGDPAASLPIQKLARTAMRTGLTRLTTFSIPDMPDDYFNNEKFNGTQYKVMPSLSVEERKIYVELMTDRTANDTVLNEMKCLKASCLRLMDKTFPESVPVFYILAKDTADSDENWQNYHEKLASNNEKSKVIVSPGTHYLHFCDVSELYNNASRWLSELE